MKYRPLSETNVIALFINPQCGAIVKKPALVERYRAILGDNGVVIAPSSVSEIDEHLLVCRRDGVKLIVVAGGDGTLHRVLNAMVTVYGEEDWPSFSVLPLGTMNIVARCLGIHQSPGRWLQQLVDGHSQEVALDLLQVSTNREVVVGFLFGNGVIAQFLHVLYDRGRSASAAVGLLASGAVSVVVGGPLITQLKRPFRGKVTTEGACHQGEFSAVAAATIGEIGLGFRAFPNAQTSPNQSEVVIFGGSLLSLAVNLPRVFFGRGVSGKANWQGLCEEVTLTSEEVWPFMVDGELYEATSASLTVMRTVRFRC